MDMLANPQFTPVPVSVLFSEPKIPQLFHPEEEEAPYTKVSVLFSEPKIPQ